MISPRAAHISFSSKVMQDALILMRSVDGITVLPGLDTKSFKPNHFVPLVDFKRGNRKVEHKVSKCQKVSKARQQPKINVVLKSTRKEATVSDGM